MINVVLQWFALASGDFPVEQTDWPATAQQRCKPGMVKLVIFVSILQVYEYVFVYSWKYFKFTENAVKPNVCTV